MNKKLLLIALSISVLFSCQKEDNNSVDNYIEPGSALVVNEGGFTKNNGSISFITLSKTVKNNIFEQSNNGLTIGDVVQSF